MCQWITKENKDGTKTPVRIGDCMQKTCKWSKAYEKKPNGGNRTTYEPSVPVPDYKKGWKGKREVER